MTNLKNRIPVEMSRIPREMIIEAVYSTKKRAEKLVKVGGEGFHGRRIVN